MFGVDAMSDKSGRPLRRNVRTYFKMLAGVYVYVSTGRLNFIHAFVYIHLDVIDCGMMTQKLIVFDRQVS